jgi:predicted nucleic acid-binding protein
MIRIFIDSGVLIAAAGSSGSVSDRALKILEDENREFISSIFVRLEVLPKSVCYQKVAEVEFYQAFFDSVEYWARDLEGSVEEAYQIASQYGLSAIDGIHVAAAILIGADEMITTERSTKPMHQVKGINVISIAACDYDDR